MSGTIESQAADGVCTVTIRHEGKRNAFTYEMLDQLTEVIDSQDRGPDSPVLVLRGAGDRAFSAGHDLTQDRTESDNQRWREATDRLVEYPYPTIAMLNGDTFGGAIHVAACCDLRVGRRGARLGITPAKIGLVYPPLAIERVLRLIGPAKTKELLFTGRTIDAVHARDIGFLNQLTAEDALESTTEELAKTIASNAPRSLTGMKWIVNASVQNGTLSPADLDRARELSRESFESDDFAEGRAAFEAGREPEFEGH